MIGPSFPARREIFLGPSGKFVGKISSETHGLIMAISSQKNPARTFSLSNDHVEDPITLENETTTPVGRVELRA